MKIAVITIIFCFTLINTSYAKNRPCSGKNGGVSHCKNEEFVCRDGSISKSELICR